MDKLSDCIVNTFWYLHFRLMCNFAEKLTGSVKVERSPPERRVCEFESQPSHTKDLKNGNRYTQRARSLRAISINQRGGCLVGGCCVNDSRVHMGNSTH